jgi:hypothetical protein
LKSQAISYRTSEVLEKHNKPLYPLTEDRGVFLVSKDEQSLYYWIDGVRNWFYFEQFLKTHTDIAYEEAQAFYRKHYGKTYDYTEEVESKVEPKVELKVEPVAPKRLTRAEHVAFWKSVVEFLRSRNIKYHSSPVLLDKETREYKFPVERSTYVIRVEKDEQRRFFWIDGTYQVEQFVEFIGKEFQGEAHEIIVKGGNRMFFDIDLKLTEEELDDLTMHFDSDNIDELAKSIAEVYNESILLSLENKGIDREELSELKGQVIEYDYAYLTRNRVIDSGYKISIHLLTNLMMHTERCSAIAADCKEMLLDAYDLGLPTDIGKLLAEAIDTMPYHKNGSLSMQYGCKVVDGKTYHNVLAKPFYLSNTTYLITDSHMCLCNVDLSAYPLRERVQQSLADFEGDFMQHALEAVRGIEGIEAFDMDLARQYGNNLIPRRMQPSHCSACDRIHDSDNTLMLSFNEEKKCCWWKCTHDHHKKWHPFYKE